MALCSNKIVEASLLRPTGEGHKTSPTPDEEATLLGEVEPPQVPDQLEVHEPVHPAEQMTSPAAFPYPLLSNQVTFLPRRQRNPSKGLKKTQPVLGSGSAFT